MAGASGGTKAWPRRVWYYSQHQLHPPVSEYFEVGTVSLIYTVVGTLVWLLVSHLHKKEAHLAASLVELEKAEARLVQEERLAAVGRLSSAIAHEIRNPVSAIVSALSTARGGALAPSEREEMFEIATNESRRLEKLTTDFLSYARPRTLNVVTSSIDDTLGYVADACRPRGIEQGVTIHVRPSAGLPADFDTASVQQALVNLVMNAVEASSRNGTVELRATGSEGTVWIEIENDGPDIPPASVARIFEPFFTTKPQGTGLGLAIARSIARAHGGDLILSTNEPSKICFTLFLPQAAVKSAATATPA